MTTNNKLMSSKVKCKYYIYFNRIPSKTWLIKMLNVFNVTIPVVFSHPKSVCYCKIKLFITSKISSSKAISVLLFVRTVIRVERQKISSLEYSLYSIIHYFFIFA